MKFKALLAGLALAVATSGVVAKDKGKEELKLNDKVDKEVKTAIEEATAEHKAAVKVGFGWRDSGKQLKEAIKAANDGEDDKAKKLAAAVKLAGERGQEQAKLAEDAAPRF